MSSFVLGLVGLLCAAFGGIIGLALDDYLRQLNSLRESIKEDERISSSMPSSVEVRNVQCPKCHADLLSCKLLSWAKYNTKLQFVVIKCKECGFHIKLDFMEAK